MSAQRTADCVVELQKRLADQSQKAGGYEHKFMKDCMEQKGYRLVTENKLPLNVKRQDPDSSLQGYLYGYRRGMAGTLDGE